MENKNQTMLQRGIISVSVRAADRRNDRYCTFSEQIDRIIRFDVRAGI